MLGLSLRRSIGAKIFGAFVIMSMITAVLGGYGFYVLSRAGKIVVDTYDRPLMAINYARSAGLTFVQMEKLLLERAAASAADRAAIDQNLDALTGSFFGDLDVARQRSLAADEGGLIAEIKDSVGQWNSLRHGHDPAGKTAELDVLSKKIASQFDLLIELVNGHSFVERRKAVWAISRFEYTSIAAMALALMLSAAITFVLSRKIIRPLTAAAEVADRIAGGELQAAIPQGGQDETGILLRSMSVMQENIRGMIDGEIAERQSAQRRFADALESVDEGMVLVDSDGRIVRANSQIAEFFPAMAPHLAEGADFATAFTEVELRLPYPLAGSGEGGATGVGAELRLADGKWVRLSRSPTQDGGFFLFVTDITEIKRREAGIRDAKKQAEAANNAKTRFLANMSHELRTPLNAIIGFSDIISRELLGRFDNPKYVEYAKEILQSGRHLLEIINDVLDLATTEAGDLQLNPEEVDIGKVLNSCAHAIAEACGAARLDFELVLPGQPVVVHGERQKLRQIFMNLLSNAVKFSNPGGKITVSVIPLSESELRIDVADTGIGMRPEDVPMALAPFGQVDSRLARSHQGTGLGLALTKRLVELHGGKLAIVSELGHGTTVSVTLSLPPAAASPAAVAKAS